MSATPRESTPQKTAAERLATPVQFLPGVGPDRAPGLMRLGLNTAQDILFFFPRDYRDMSRVCRVEDLTEDEFVSIRGRIEEIEMRNTSPGRNMLGVLLRQDNEYFRAIWFNQPFMRRRLAVGQNMLLSGKAKRNGLRWEMVHPRVHVLESDTSQQGEILPIYSLTEGIKQSHLRKIAQHVVADLATEVPDVLPTALREGHNLLPIAEALLQIHHPTDNDMLEQARRRFIFQELLVLQLAISLRRHQIRAAGNAVSLPTSARIDARIRRLFEFPFTPGQELAIREMTEDLAETVPMNRLLQGDVGCGKTVVAVYALLLAVAHHQQAALMAPTEVLASQHFQFLGKILAAANVRVGFLAGSLTAAQRRDTLTAIARGEVDVVIGTQAIIQDGVEFDRLALVVVDEQHKFGVQQRAKLRGSGVNPHYLVMTATPIPRTVAMTSFGDLDISTILDSPPGRQDVQTYLGTPEQREKWWEFFRRKLREGRQGYVVTPLVDGDADSLATSLAESFEALCNGELEAFRLDLIHGRMSSADKQLAMDRFRRGETQVLVATSVVEVGVDIPNATVMTIENGERFGLAQLHQLRGRVGRGSHPGFACVYSEAHTEESRTRLEKFVATNNGFELAEFDFQLRGPGDLLGTRQHGLPPLRIANLQRDHKLLDEARAAASELLPTVSDPDYAALWQQVMRRYGERLALSDVG